MIYAVGLVPSYRVSESLDTRMSIDNLAKVFGPTIVGYSVATPQPMQMIAETRPQQDVMISLLEHNTDYWADILSGNSSEVGSLDYDMTDTPDQGRRRPAGKQVYRCSTFHILVYCSQCVYGIAQKEERIWLLFKQQVDMVNDSQLLVQMTVMSEAVWQLFVRGELPSFDQQASLLSNTVLMVLSH